jgi:23S rRNA (adenine-N6)-dimethyltransferase
VRAAGKPARAARQWNWHQLDSHWAERVVAAAGIRPGDLVVDVGAGHGALTEPLVAAGARVIAVELHPRRLDALRDRFADDDVVVVRADAASLRLPRRPFRVVANPPFNVTTALLRRLLAPGSRLLSADLVLPRHSVVRWASGRGRGAGRWSASHSVALGTRVPRSAFRPHATTDCATLVVRRR